MTKILIVFYSRSGHSKLIAETLAKELNCESVEITEPRSRNGIFGYIRSIMDMIKQKSPVINPLNLNVDSFDIILLGTPIWGGTFASPLRTFLGQYGKTIKKWGLFTSRGGSALPKNISDLTKLVGKDPIASLNLVQRDFKTDGWKANLMDFIAKIR